MGVFKVHAVIWNPENKSRKEIINLLVDTGATYTVLPESLLLKLGITPIRKTKLRLAGNRVIERDVGEVGIEVEGHTASATPTVFGEENVYLLGAVTMEQLGLAPDPITKRLKPVEALLMKV